MTNLKIKVRYIGSIHQRLGKKEEIFSMIGGVIVKDLLKCIDEKYGGEFQTLFYEKKGSERLAILVTKNNALVGAGESLGDGDEVALIPMIAGG